MIATPSDAKVYAIVRNRNHVEILHPTILELERRGYSCGYYIYPALQGADRARAALDAMGRNYGLANRVDDMAKAGDLIVYCLQSRLCEGNRIPKVLARGVRIAHVVEGCRFLRDYRYHTDVPVFGWGPSIKAFMPERVTVVGSPIVEGMLSKSVARQNIAVINYKFTWQDAKKDPDGTWAANAVQACLDNGLTPILSGHPGNQSLPEGVSIAAEPIADLLARAKILISRASTVVYQSLAIGVQPFYFPIADELRLEFEDPRGSFPVAQDGASLTAQIAAWSNGQATYDQSAFLKAHVDIDPKRSASLRLADALENLLRS